MITNTQERFAYNKVSAILIAMSSVVTLPTFAQEQPNEDKSKDRGSLLEVISVTATKSVESVQEVPIAITAFSGEQLNSLGASSAVDVAAQVPGVNISSFHQSYAAFNIRGVSQNDFADHLEPPIALYADEAYVPYPGAATAQMFDVERAEILRGPQGTLFGRNATGGLIHLVSRAPNDFLEGYISASVGEYNLRKLEGAIGGALTDDLNARVSFISNNHDGWFENRIGEDLMNADNYAYRLQFQYLATDDTEIALKLHGSRNNDETGSAYNHTPTVANSNALGRAVGSDEIASWPNIVLGGTVTAPCEGCDLLGYKEPDNDSRTGSIDHVGYFHRDVDGGTLKITSDFDAFTFVSVTDYMTIDKQFSGDIDGTPNPFFVFTTAQDSSHFAQELRLDGTSEGLKWTAGLYYLDMESTYASIVNFDVSPYLGLPPGSVIGPSSANWDLDATSWAIFGQIQYDFSENLKTIFGVRYTEDEKSMNYILNDAGGEFLFNKNTHPDLAEPNYENVSVHASLNWHPTKDWMLYGSLTRGHKAGNFAAPSFGVPADPSFRENVLPTILPHDEEVLTSYEIGAKGDMLDGKARLNASLYYYDYDDYQVFSLQNAAQAIFNRDAKVSGAEIELVATPVESMEIILGVASMFEKTVYDVPLPLMETDREMPLSPDLTLNGLIRYEWEAFDGYITAQADFNWTDEYYFYALNEPITKQDSYAVANLRLSYITQDDAWEFSVWGKNIFNKEYDEFRLDISTISLCSCAPSAPRWVGVTAKYSY